MIDGGFGKIFKGQYKEIKMQGMRKPVIIKFTKNHQMNDLEFKALSDVLRYSKA